MYNIAVIGAGVIGLSTALNIQKTITNAKVRIIADKFVTKTTSYGAAGIFLPLYSSFPDTPRDKLRSWYTDSWKFYSSLALSSEADGSGFMVCPGYVPCNTRNEENHLYKDIVFSYKEMTQSEMEKLNINGFKYCYQVTTVITTCSVYLSWLLERFKENGGEVEQRTIYNIQEFVGKYDVIVNCSGFGSRELFNDKSLSIRGQIAKVVAPWIKTWYYPDDGSYIIVNRDRVILGGTKQAYNENKDIVETDSKKIMEGCIRVVPALKGYKLDQEWVGLRPGRSTVRLEKEIIPRQNGTLKKYEIKRNMSLCFDDNIEKRRLPSASEIILNPRYENMGFIRDSYDRLDGGYTDHNTKSNGEPYKKLSEITASSLSSAYHNPFTHHLYEDLRFSDDESVVSSVPGSPMTARSHSVKSKASTHGTFTRQLNLFIGEEWENVQPHTQDFQRKAFSCPSSPQTKRNITVTKQPGTKGDDTEELTPSDSKHRSYDHVKQFFLDMPIEPPAPKHFRLEPNPHNTINHMCHSALHCPCFLFFCFLCCLPGVYYMLQGDKSYKCGKEEKAIIYGKRSTILYVIGTILAIVLLGGVVFFAVLFVQDQVG